MVDTSTTWPTLASKGVSSKVPGGDVADMFCCVVDGGIIMSRALGDPRRLERQILAFRSFVKLLFAPAARHALPHPAVAAE